MSKLPEGIDYTILSNDPGDEADDCIHDVDSGPHEHSTVRACLRGAAAAAVAALWFLEKYWPLVLVIPKGGSA